MCTLDVHTQLVLESWTCTLYSNRYSHLRTFNYEIYTKEAPAGPSVLPTSIIISHSLQTSKTRVDLSVRTYVCPGSSLKFFLPLMRHKCNPSSVQNQTILIFRFAKTTLSFIIRLCCLFAIGNVARSYIIYSLTLA